MKLFEYDIHLGRHKVLVQTRDIADEAISSQKIANKAVTREKLADEVVEMLISAANGGSIDLSRLMDGGFYTKMEIDDMFDNVNVDMSDYYDKEDIKRLLKNVEVDLSDYYDKDEVDGKFTDSDGNALFYRKSEVDQLLKTLKQGQFVVADSLPDPGLLTLFSIYLIPNTPDEDEDNIRDEYVTIASEVNGETTYRWEKIGSTRIDLTGYATERWVNNQGFLKEHQSLKDYVKKSELKTVSDKVDGLSGLSGNVDEFLLTLGSKANKISVTKQITKDEEDNDVVTYTPAVKDCIATLSEMGDLQNSNTKIDDLLKKSGGTMTGTLKMKSGQEIGIEIGNNGIIRLKNQDGGSYIGLLNIGNGTLSILDGDKVRNLYHEGNLPSFLTEHQSIRTLNGQTITGDGDLKTLSAVVDFTFPEGINLDSIPLEDTEVAINANLDKLFEDVAVYAKVGIFPWLKLSENSDSVEFWRTDYYNGEEVSFSICRGHNCSVFSIRKQLKEGTEDQYEYWLDARGTFSLNGITKSQLAPGVIPTKTSQLTNDSLFGKVMVNTTFSTNSLTITPNITEPYKYYRCTAELGSLTLTLTSPTSANTTTCFTYFVYFKANAAGALAINGTYEWIGSEPALTAGARYEICAVWIGDKYLLSYVSNN